MFTIILMDYIYLAPALQKMIVNSLAAEINIKT